MADQMETFTEHIADLGEPPPQLLAATRSLLRALEDFGESFTLAVSGIRNPSNGMLDSAGRRMSSGGTALRQANNQNDCAA